ncbi:hypothetical protein [Mycobacterium spongiae]|uniref:Uncharacterized protein n=1 Tax=Mycobacterium spongiae TaxID=886343 RepID=A0A975JZ27_9MYCO|nr:hypothetical protein [Mycobacterium spongiae]QUR67714.1 hypothetical protein F6B93_11925 [Mycobacterium spongiae]
MASTSGASVIYLHSHPTWTAAQEHERLRREAMRRHPAFLARQRMASRGDHAAPVVRNLRLCADAHTPAVT